MPTRKASAHWEGGLKGGKGTFSGESTAIGGQYSFSSRFESGVGSNPEELLAAAEAACFSMALAGRLEKGGTPPASIDTQASCTVETAEGVSAITKMHLVVSAAVPGIDDAKFQEAANATLTGCPVSKAFNGNVQLSLEARLAS
jgi:osmotically inducible protein OsmC